MNKSEDKDFYDKYIKKLNVIYEDNHLIVVEKYINILSQKDSTGDIDMNTIVMEYLRNKYQKPGNVYVGLIHRLDRRVGGVMVFAKTSKAASRLSNDIKNHNFKKTYLCLAQGDLNNGQYTDYLYKDEKLKLSIVVERDSPNAKEAKLNYEKINNVMIDGQVHTYAMVDLITGRYNQIRCQMGYHHHPLIHDYKYGYSYDNGDIGLFCYRVELIHPVLKERMEFKITPKTSIWKGLKIKDEKRT